MKVEKGLLASIAIAVAATALAQEPSRTGSQRLSPAVRADQEQLNSLENERKSAAKLTPEQQKMLLQGAERLRLKSKADVEALPVGPGGGGVSGGTKMCLQDCETVYERCVRNAGDWFERYLCNLDAAKCTILCAGKF